MEIEFHTDDLDRLETEAEYNADYAKEIVKAYRKRIQAIRAANDERDLRAVKGNHFEKLQGDRSHQYSMKINDQWRLVIEIKASKPKNIIVVMSIEDYH
jgi:proteic killer suppression protein